MEILNKFLAPNITLEQFLKVFYEKEPYASPDQALEFCKILSWSTLQEIFRIQSEDSWPVRQGHISKEFANSKGKLIPDLARCAFANGHSIVVRHAEKGNMQLKMIAEEFQNFFQRSVDLQVYLTPAGQEGFGWHYDVEEVFIIQTQGRKEFRLLKNTVTPRPLSLFTAENSQFSFEQKAPEIRYLLQAGDWLYIPAGYWHKAKALSDSFHISVGVM